MQRHSIDGQVLTGWRIIHGAIPYQPLSSKQAIILEYRHGGRKGIHTFGMFQLLDVYWMDENVVQKNVYMKPFDVRWGHGDTVVEFASKQDIDEGDTIIYNDI